MSQSPRLTNKESQTTKRPKTPQSASMLLIATALDTTWRAFLPTLGGTFLGIWIDATFHIAPVGLIVMVLLGVVISGLLIARQLRDVRKDL